jgi:hypothetical protein
MSLTFLQIAQRIRQEVGGAGTGPATVVGQSGESRRIIDWAATADEDIQRKTDLWKFMVGTFSLNTVAGDGSYSTSDCIVPITNLREWKIKTFKSYLLASGTANESELVYINYQDWYDTYNVGTQTNGRPQYFSIGNDMSIKLGPIPDDVYRISGEYQKSVTTLTANSDVPVYPAEFHMLPVYRAMMKYARYTGATEIFQDAEIEYNKMMRQMERSQLPKTTLARPLA